jgi:hypothetical protein
MRRAPSAIVPAVSGAMPVTALISVVLPAPLGPMRPSVCPGCTVKDTSSSATTPP